MVKMTVARREAGAGPVPRSPCLDRARSVGYLTTDRHSDHPWASIVKTNGVCPVPQRRRASNSPGIVGGPTARALSCYCHSRSQIARSREIIAAPPSVPGIGVDSNPRVRVCRGRPRSEDQDEPRGTQRASLSVSGATGNEAGCERRTHEARGKNLHDNPDRRDHEGTTDDGARPRRRCRRRNSRRDPAASGGDGNEFERDIAHAPLARARIPLQAALQEFAKPCGCGGRQLRPVRILQHDGPEDFGDAVAGKTAARSEFERTRQRPDVARRSTGLPLACSGEMYAECEIIPTARVRG